MEEMNREYASEVDFGRVPQANHWICEENPVFVVDRIKQFLSDHDIHRGTVNGKGTNGTVANGHS